jgi:glycosyltransferase involved in cell wall biosynthesis
VKKIAIVTYSLRMGGVESVIFNLGKSFINKGFEVEIIETLEVGVWKKYFAENNFKVVSIVKKPFITAISHSKQIASYLNKFEIVLLNDTPLAQSALGFLRPEILVFPIMHNTFPSMAINAAGNKGQWDKIIAVSPMLKEYLMDQVNILTDADIICIPNGININKYRFTAKPSSQKKKLLYLGRISEEKGVMLLPDIIDEIRNHNCFDFLDIYGNGALDEELSAKIKDYKLQSKINIKGAIDPEHVSHILVNYDILIMPSFKEGHPIVLLEAMACGVVPVVSLLEGSTDIVVDHCVNGYLCEKRNIKEFQLYLTQALENNDLSDMANLASETIVDKYAIEKMSNCYLKLFDDFTNNKKNRTAKIDLLLLGDYPRLPYIMVRPFRKINRMIMKLFKESK